MATVVAAFTLGILAGLAIMYALGRRTPALETLVDPIREGLEKYDRKLHELELTRVDSMARLNQQLDMMSLANDMLRGETLNLSRALRSSNVRGAWGELQLKRAVELAGMVEHCDFTTQATMHSDDGRLRPDMVVHLPGGRSIVIDAKTPAAAILEAINCDNDALRLQLMEEHVGGVRRHIAALNRKAYWEQFEVTPEFVVMFLPSEAFFSVALETDPSLFEFAFEQKVIIATPTTLVALLKAVAYGWRQDAVARNAHEISELGRDLYERIRSLGEHFANVGDHLRKSVVAYNRAVGTLENRVMPSARHFQTLGVASTKEIAELSRIETTPLNVKPPASTERELEL